MMTAKFDYKSELGELAPCWIHEICEIRGENSPERVKFFPSWMTLSLLTTN